jgi:hypothetical protein
VLGKYGGVSLALIMADHRNSRSEDYFVCPNCHTEVSIHAKSCPECGADDETGWKEGAEHAGVLGEVEDDFDYDDFVARDMGKKAPSKGKQAVFIAIGAALLAGLLLLRWLGIW